MKRHTFLTAILLLALARSAQADYFQTFFIGGALVPDGNLVGWSDTRTVSGVSGSISNVSVTLDLTGGWNGDLYAYLVHDTGFAVLLNRVGRDTGNLEGYGTAGMNVTLSDTAVLGNIHSVSTPAPSGVYQPDGRDIDPRSPQADFGNPLNPTALLGSFNGGNPNGNWTLFIADVQSGDVTAVQSWGLNIALVPEPSCLALLFLGGMIGVYRLKGAKVQPQPAADSVSFASFRVSDPGSGKCRYPQHQNMTMKLRLPLFVCSAVIACLSAGSALAQVTASQIYQGLVSYWPMDTITSGATPDVVSGINLTAANSPSTTAGKFGNGIVLNGSNQYLYNTDTQMLGGGTNNLASGLPYFAGTPFTVAFWVEAAAPTTANHYLFTMGNTANNQPLYCLQSGSSSTWYNKLDAIVRPIQNNPPINHLYTANNTFLDGTWHHVAWVDNYGVISVYEDGVLINPAYVFSYFPKQLISPNAITGVSGGAPTDAWVIPLNTTCFGALVRGSPGGYLAATFDDAGIWNRAVSQAEIQYIVANGIPAYSPTLNPGYPGFAVPLPSSQTNSMGDYVTLKANAYGAPPLSLQWYSNNVALPDATNQVLCLYNLTTSGTNVIYVTAANNSGSPTVTNGPMNLVVPPDPTPALSVGCYGYWPLDTINLTGTLTNTPDLYNGNNFNLANMTSASLISGEFSNALDFASTAGYAYLDSIIPPFNSTTYTVSFWVNAPANTAQPNGCVFGNTSSSSGQPLFLLGYSSQNIALNNLVVFLRQDQSGPNPQLNWVEAASTVFDGTWHHVTWVDKAGSVTLYVDGVIDPVDFSYVRTNANPTLRTNQTWTLTSECLANRWASKPPAAT